MPRPLPPITANRRRRIRPSRWALCAVVLAALLCLGSREAPDYGEGVGIFDNGALMVDLGWDDKYVSSDGGYSWQPLYIWEAGARRFAPGFDERWEDAVRWGEAEVETPRGRYVVEENEFENLELLLDVRIIRIEGDAKDVAYAPPHLQNAADRRFWNRRYVEKNSLPWDAPANLVYHPDSGNIVAVLGLERVVVGDAEGNWRPLLDEIGERAPDVSVRSKIAFALGGVWSLAILFAITATAAALALTGRSIGGRAAVGDASSLILSGLLGFVGLVPTLGGYALVSFLWNDDLLALDLRVTYSQVYIFNALLAALGAVAVWRKVEPWFGIASFLLRAAVPLIIAVAIIGFFEDGGFFGDGGFNLGYAVAAFASIVSVAGAVAIWYKIRVLVGASNFVLACVVCIVGIIVVHARGPYGGVGEFGEALALAGVFFAGSFSGLMALISFAPSSVRHLPFALAVAFGAAGILALPFAIDAALGFHIWAAKIYAIIFLLAALLIFDRYLRKSQPPSHPD